jgi:hypothetical protein
MLWCFQYSLSSCERSLFCCYWWNCWPSLFKLSFHKYRGWNYFSYMYNVAVSLIGGGKLQYTQENHRPVPHVQKNIMLHRGKAFSGKQTHNWSSYEKLLKMSANWTLTEMEKSTELVVELTFATRKKWI